MKPSRHWASWDAGFPAAMRHLPSGVRLTPLVYAASTGKASFLPPGPGVKLGPRTTDASRVSLRFEHAGTSLAWNWWKPDEETVCGEWQAQRHGEWGLRFWVTLCLSSDGPGEWIWENGTARLGDVVVRPEREPLLITAHENLASIAAEFETHGYWYLASRATRGPVLALRFNLDEMPSLRFAAAVGKAPQITSPALADDGGPLHAVRDIMGWNSTWDPVNARPYTSCSRNWDLAKFGGFGIWLTDTAVNAMLLSALDAEMAAENLAALRAHQTQAGNFSCLVTGHDAWPDRSQPPIVSLLVWLIHLRDGDVNWLAENYEALARNHAWWWQTRDGNANGLLEYGSSPVGDGLYLGTKLAAKDESFMDNSPMHDEARFMAEARTLDMEDVGLNCLITLDAEILSMMAEKLGRGDEASAHAARAAAQRARISHFWDGSRGIFANRLWSGAFASATTPTSFYPLLCGAADTAQKSALLAALDDPARFGGTFGLASVSRDHPSFADNVYWRGRIWPILNWLVWLGLKRAGAHAEAASLIEKSWRLFRPAWEARLAPENFNADTGEGLDQPDTDSFYSWTALLPFMRVASLIDIDPWDGWLCVNEGPDDVAGPMRSPWGLITASRKAGHFRITREDGAVIFETTARGRIKADCRG